MRIVPRHNVNVDVEELIQAVVAAALKDPQSEPGLFENRFRKWSGTREAIAVSSGRAGIKAALSAVGVVPGSEVIIPEYTFHVVPSIVEAMGATPVLANVVEGVYVPSPEEISRRINSSTSAVLIANLFGGSADLGTVGAILREKNIPLILDCAHGCGTRFRGYHLGAWGDAAIYSFGTGKNLACLGGGMITTMNSELGSRIRKNVLRTSSDNHLKSFIDEAVSMMHPLLEMLLSRKPVYAASIFPVLYGLNQIDRHLVDQIFEESLSTPEEMSKLMMKNLGRISSALGISQLKKINRLNRMRRMRARFLNEKLCDLRDIILPAERAGLYHTYLCYAVMVRSAAETASSLMKHGIDVRMDYITSLTGEYTDRVLYLPNHPGLNRKDMEWIARKVPECL